MPVGGRNAGELQALGDGDERGVDEADRRVALQDLDSARDVAVLQGFHVELARDQRAHERAFGRAAKPRL